MALWVLIFVEVVSIKQSLTFQNFKFSFAQKTFLEY